VVTIGFSYKNGVTTDHD